MYAHCTRKWRVRFVTAILCGFVCHGAVAEEAAATGADIESLREALNQLRQDYQTRMTELEARLDAALAATASAPAQPAAPAASVPYSGVAAAAGRGSAIGNSNEFNPAIGVIFQGQAWQSRLDEDQQTSPGFPAGGEAGPVPEGLAIAETEIDISANVDDLFTARLTVPLVIEDGETAVEIEEAWIETLGMPGGLATRFGRFYSGIGYLNSRHSHSWDFMDQPLAYQAFLGNQYLDDGVQLRWLAPTDLYLEVGGELLRGDRYPAAGAAGGGVGSQSLFARTGGDVGSGHSWQAGISYLRAKSRERPSGPADDPLLFTGDTDLIVAEFLWKWAPRGNWRQRNLIVQSEYLWRNEQGSYLLPDGSNPEIDRAQRGWYAQVVYQPFPQWRVGARVDLLSSDQPGAAFAGTALDPAGHDPDRYTVMVDWSHSEFSRLRLQYARDRSTLRDDDQWGLQYIHSIGAHGAHSF